MLEQRLESLRKLQALELRRRETEQRRLLENLGTSRYRTLARKEQLPPDSPWRIWLLETGRGFGKTFSGAGWLVENALSTPDSEWAVIAPTYTDVRRICVEGPSGILKMLRREELQDYNRSTGLITLINATVIHMISGEKPNRTRGLNLSGAWCDEFSSWQYQEEMWNEVLVPALRIGRGKTVITTTPYGSKILRSFKDRHDESVVVTHGSIDDNAANLSPEALRDMHERLDGTRVGRRELYGEDLYDTPGALWHYEDILICADPPEMKRVIISVDPAVTVTETSDETGIVVVGKGVDNNIYVLGDFSCKDTAFGWAKRVKALYDEFGASLVIYEQNQGGTVYGDILKQIDPYLPSRPVHAELSKQRRAEPVAMIYEKHQAFHVKHFEKLEDQFVTWDPESRDSPDRLDAAVHGIRELMDIGAGSRFLLDLAQMCPHCQMPNTKGDTVCFSCHKVIDG